jgi:hypothetical protein
MWQRCNGLPKPLAHTGVPSKFPSFPKVSVREALEKPESLSTGFADGFDARHMGILGPPPYRQQKDFNR